MSDPRAGRYFSFAVIGGHRGRAAGHELLAMVLARRELNRWAKRDEAERAGTLEPRHATRMV